MKGASLTAKSYPGANVKAIPFVSIPIKPAHQNKSVSLIYTGFIGKKKGLDYALKIHCELMKEFAFLRFKVVGTAVDEISRNYLKSLSNRYESQVDYLGYVDDRSFIKLLSEGNILLLPTENYKTICPVSGNVINALSAGSVVVTSRANANEEVIENGSNGYFLSGVANEDVQIISNLLRDPSLRRRIIDRAQRRILSDNNPQLISAYF
jgi:glycosyltransferase involved in cell wall biosynthesis